MDGTVEQQPGDNADGQPISPGDVVSPPELMINNQSVQKIGVEGRVQDDAEEGLDPNGGEAGADVEGQQEVDDYEQEQQQMGLDPNDPSYGINDYVEGDTYGAPKDLLPKDREDLETIIESISYGKIQQLKKL